MMRGADPVAFEALADEVGRAAITLAAVRRTLPVPAVGAVAHGLADIEDWLRRQEDDLRRRRAWLDEPDITLLRPELHATGRVLVGAGRALEWGAATVVAMGEEFDRFTEASAQVIIATGHGAAAGAGPFAPAVEDGAAVAAEAMKAVGNGMLTSAEREAHVLAMAGRRLERVGGNLVRAVRSGHA